MRRVSTPSPYTWTCAGCRRQVPLRVDRCHCGRTREESQLAAAATARPTPTLEGLVARPGWRGVWRSMPADVRAMAVAASALALAGVVWLAIGPAGRVAEAPLLGYAEPTPPTTRPPAFRLPWWK